MLIVLRGNSGSDKSTSARLLRKSILERQPDRRGALVEQDYIRRTILKEKESEGTDNIALIDQTVRFALDREYIVFLEGFLYAQRYGSMLARLLKLAPEQYVYYFDIPFDETLRRHQNKPNAHEFGEREMRAWYREKDFLGVFSETIIDHSLHQQEIVIKILADARL